MSAAVDAHCCRLISSCGKYKNEQKQAKAVDAACVRNSYEHVVPDVALYRTFIEFRIRRCIA